jgi:hypothetical protein
MIQICQAFCFNQACQIQLDWNELDADTSRASLGVVGTLQEEQ